MFSFEAHVKLLSLFAIMIPIFCFLTLGCLRFYYYSNNNELPKWVNFLNQDVLGRRDLMQDISTVSGETGSQSLSELIFAVLYYSYIVSKVILGIFLWRATSRKKQKNLFVWILCCVFLTMIGFLLLGPLKRNHVIEVGLAVVYTKVSAIYSAYTLIVVIFLIVKIKHRHILEPQPVLPPPPPQQSPSHDSQTRV